jgi:hypothetical protein
MVSGDQQRDALLFITTHGYVPWDARAPAAAALNARSAQLIEGKAQEVVLQAEARAEAESVVPKTDEVGEALELVIPPPETESPETFGGGGRGR